LLEWNNVNNADCCIYFVVYIEFNVGLFIARIIFTIGGPDKYLPHDTACMVSMSLIGLHTYLPCIGLRFYIKLYMTCINFSIHVHYFIMISYWSIGIYRFFRFVIMDASDNGLWRLFADKLCLMYTVSQITCHSTSVHNFGVR